jgi:hypothetical protein
VITGADAYSPDGNARDVADIVRKRTGDRVFTAAVDGRLVSRVAAMLDCTTPRTAPLTCSGTTLHGRAPDVAGKDWTLQTTFRDARRCAPTCLRRSMSAARRRS